MTYTKDGIQYKTPNVYLLDNTNMLFAEFFARTAYDSYDKSENELIRTLKHVIDSDDKWGIESARQTIKAIKEPSSDLLHQLSHVYFHESTIEHISFNFYIKGISRALLQELARHRLASYTVRSTRYTMTDILHNFLCFIKFKEDSYEARVSFIEYIKTHSEYFVVDDLEYLKIEASTMFDKLYYQLTKISYDGLVALVVPKSLVESFEACVTIEEGLYVLRSKAKRNLGDPFKHIISENISVDLGLSINLRALKNMFDLRLNGSAWFQFQVLMNEMFKVMPKSYMDLINSGKLDNIQSNIETNIQSGDFN
jgi:thymidylate synthase (FAD)